MHRDLELMYEKFIDILRQDKRCKGGWHYGSISRNTQDMYSDYDLVFLVEDIHFEEFARDISAVLAGACDELLIFWEEDFSDQYFKNYCSVIRMGESLHQFDVFMINQDYPDTWMCKLHCKGCGKKDIIFDQNGEVAEFLGRGYGMDNEVPDTIRAIDTYWLHIEMLIKYFKRRDIFKLMKNVDIIFHAHVDLLLSAYDTLDWGGWESKVKHCVPEEKQEHLKGYFAKADFAEVEEMMRKNMYLFQKDTLEICEEKGIVYSEEISKKVISYFEKRMDIV